MRSNLIFIIAIFLNGCLPPSVSILITKAEYKSKYVSEPIIEAKELYVARQTYMPDELNLRLKKSNITKYTIILKSSEIINGIDSLNLSQSDITYIDNHQEFKIATDSVYMIKVWDTSNWNSFKEVLITNTLILGGMSAIGTFADGGEYEYENPLIVSAVTFGSHLCLYYFRRADEEILLGAHTFLRP